MNLLTFLFLFCLFFVTSDRTIKVWGLDSLSESLNQETKLKAKAIVAAHDKDINCLAVSPNDALVCSGSQVGIWFLLIFFLIIS